MITLPVSQPPVIHADVMVGKGYARLEPRKVEVLVLVDERPRPIKELLQGRVSRAEVVECLIERCLCYEFRGRLWLSPGVKVVRR